MPKKHPGLNTFCWYTMVKEYLAILQQDTGVIDGPLFCNPRPNPGRSGSKFTLNGLKRSQLSVVGTEVAKALKLDIPNLYHDKCWVTSAEEWDPWRKYQITQYDVEVPPDQTADTSNQYLDNSNMYNDGIKEES